MYIIDVRASSFLASGGLEPAFFLRFQLWAGLGSARFASDMWEPQFFGLWAGSGLAKLPSDGWAGSPRLRLDTSLMHMLTSSLGSGA